MQGIAGASKYSQTHAYAPGPHPHTHSCMLTYTVGTIFVAAHNYSNAWQNKIMRV